MDYTIFVCVRELRPQDLTSGFERYFNFGERQGVTWNPLKERERSVAEGVDFSLSLDSSY